MSTCEKQIICEINKGTKEWEDQQNIQACELAIDKAIGMYLDCDLSYERYIEVISDMDAKRRESWKSIQVLAGVDPTEIISLMRTSRGVFVFRLQQD